MDWKRALYEKVAPHIAPGAIFASNTSGLSINALADACPEAMRSRFCGIHFFNPPRYMHLVELIPQRHTDAGLLDQLETFLVTTLGKGVVRAQDTPKFVANRVGRFSMLATMVHTEAYGLGFDVVDALTGPAIGRARSATYRTADVVGLDTMAHVIRTLEETLPDDPWHRYYHAPSWLAALIDKGALGQKTRAGVFQKVGKDIQVLDLKTQAYRLSSAEIDPGVAAILAIKNRRPSNSQKLRAHPASSGAVALGHFSRPVSLLRVSPRHHRRQRARCRPRHPLGFRLAGRAVRNMAVGGMEGHRATGRRGYRGGQGACVGAVAAVGHRGGRCRTRSAHGAKAPCSPSPADRYLPAALDPAGLSHDSIFPDPILGEPSADEADDLVETDAVRMWHTGRRHRHRLVQEQAEHRWRRCARRLAGGDRRGREKLARAGHLADTRAVLAGRESRFTGTSHTRRCVGWRRCRHRQVPADHATAQVQPRADRRRRSRHGARAAPADTSCIATAPLRFWNPISGSSKRERRPPARQRRRCKEIATRSPRTRPQSRRAVDGSQLDPFPFLRTYFQTGRSGQQCRESALNARKTSDCLRSIGRRDLQSHTSCYGLRRRRRRAMSEERLPATGSRPPASRSSARTGYRHA